MEEQTLTMDQALSRIKELEDEIVRITQKKEVDNATEVLQGVYNLKDDILKKATYDATELLDLAQIDANEYVNKCLKNFEEYRSETLQKINQDLGSKLKQTRKRFEEAEELLEKAKNLICDEIEAYQKYIPEYYDENKDYEQLTLDLVPELPKDMPSQLLCERIDKASPVDNYTLEDYMNDLSIEGLEVNVPSKESSDVGSSDDKSDHPDDSVKDPSSRENMSDIPLNL